MVFDKTGRNTTASKVQRFPKGLLMIDGGRIEVEGVHLFDDFFDLAIDTTNKYTVGTEGTGAAVDITAALNGVLQIDTGTDVDNRNCIASRLNFSGARGVTAEFRIKTTTSDAGLLLFCGLTDLKDEGSGLLPIADTALAAATITANASDFAGFAVRAETNDNVYCVSGKAGTLQSSDSATDIVLDTWLKLRIEVDTDGNAKFYINDTFITELEDALTASDPLCLYLGGLITTGSAAAFIQMDFWGAHQARIV